MVDLPGRPATDLRAAMEGIADRLPPPLSQAPRIRRLRRAVVRRDHWADIARMAAEPMTTFAHSCFSGKRRVRAERTR